MQITWFGHSAFRLDVAGHVVLIDPFFTGNPAFVTDKEAAIKGVTHIVLTHGHGDHVGDTLQIAEATGAPVVANYDRNGADRRPFHHEPEDCCAGGQALLQAQEGDSLPLRLVPHYRAQCE
jgi:L-ascorbate metabolism protein UlaG (beta-lactamase superfamily)